MTDIALRQTITTALAHFTARRYSAHLWRCLGRWVIAASGASMWRQPVVMLSWIRSGSPESSTPSGRGSTSGRRRS
ncbi:MAG: hypothetical protein EOM24_25090 [Chloroflexia bacterium]|nr:hypothetical protein [Chloroflexia bacterium]